MTRERWFCCLCGALTAAPAMSGGRYFCRAHTNLAVALDAMPPDPLESLPVMGDELGCEIAYGLRPTPTISRSARSAGSEAAHHAPLTGEVVSPADGTEHC